MATLFQDLRFSIRQLRKSPGFAITAILTLALGIGAVTSIFSVVNAVLLKPFPFREPDRLVILREIVKEMSAQYPAVPANYRHYLRLKRDAKTLEDATIFKDRVASASPNGDHPHIARAVAVSPNFFSVLGIQPMLGRDFTPEEATSGHQNVVILSYSGWQRFFNGDANVVGRALRLDGVPSTVIGVLPRGIRFPDISLVPGMPSNANVTAEARKNEIFHPLVPDPHDLKNDIYDYKYKVIARLKPNITVAHARAELDGLQHAYALSARLPIHIGIYLQPLAEDVTTGISLALWLLFAAVGGVLLIACVNLANLQLARALASERETAIRFALGASRSQQMLPRLMESLVLATIGGLAGVGLSFLGVRLLLAVGPVDVPRLQEAQVSVPVLLFAAGLSVFTALLFGILPSLRLLSVNPQRVLQLSPSRVANIPQSSRTRKLLVGAEVACTIVLLILTGLALRSFAQVLWQERGFDSGQVTIAQVGLFTQRYRNSQPNAKAAKADFIDRALASLEQSPGVQSVAMISAMPLTGETWIDFLTRPDRPLPEAQTPKANVRWISPGYLSTMRIALVGGRDFTFADRSDYNHVLISEKAARDAFPDENPIGKRIQSFNPNDHTYIIVGVVADARVNGLKDIAAMVYLPYWENPPQTVSFLVRSSQSTAALSAEVRRVIWGIDPEVTIPTMKSLDEQVSDSIASDRFQSILLSSFGAAALLLSLLGVYGMLTYSVSLRQQEFGIRIALGADKSHLMALVLWEAGYPILLGVGVGLVLASLTTRWVRSLLYQTQIVDPVAIGGSVILLLVAAVLATVLPARRATDVDPMRILRNE